MNKQELINELKKLLAKPSEAQGTELDFVHEYCIRRAIILAKQLDEPVRPPEPKPLEIEKPVVPQFVADWYEENKDDFERNLYNFFLLFHEGRLQGDLDDWFTNNRNKPIETLVMMHKFGYEVEKERKYTIRAKGIDQRFNWLMRDEQSGEYVFGSPKKPSCQLIFTEKELARDDMPYVLYNDAFEVEEVEE